MDHRLKCKTVKLSEKKTTTGNLNTSELGEELVDLAPKVQYIKGKTDGFNQS